MNITALHAARAAPESSLSNIFWLCSRSIERSASCSERKGRSISNGHVWSECNLHGSFSANPIIFDDEIINTPLLYSELFPIRRALDA